MTTGILQLMKSIPKDGRRDLVGDRGVHFKNCYCQGGRVQFLYVIIWEGYSFDTPRISENPRRPMGRNIRFGPLIHLKETSF